MALILRTNQNISWKNFYFPFVIQISDHAVDGKDGGRYLVFIHYLYGIDRRTSTSVRNGKMINTGIQIKQRSPIICPISPVDRVRFDSPIHD